MNPPLLTVRNLTKHFTIKRGFPKSVTYTVKAVENVSFSIKDPTLGRSPHTLGEEIPHQPPTEIPALRQISQPQHIPSRNMGRCYRENLILW